MAVFQGACSFNNDLVCFWGFKMIFLAFQNAHIIQKKYYNHYFK